MEWTAVSKNDDVLQLYLVYCSYITMDRLCLLCFGLIPINLTVISTEFWKTRVEAYTHCVC